MTTNKTIISEYHNGNEGQDRALLAEKLLKIFNEEDQSSIKEEREWEKDVQKSQ